ncbi:unnamed protein product [Effrenium voratum]|nr:unnamed protein product [Effrenium voratum]
MDLESEHTQAAMTEGKGYLPKPSLSRAITPGYMAAVMSSPEVLCHLCSQYFRQYDKDKNGLLDCQEAVVLAKELGTALAVPMGSTEEVLRPSIARFSEEGRDALTLEEFCRWFPSVLGLEPLSPQHIEEIKSGTHNLAPAAVPQPSLRRTITPGYAAALASSPQTLQSFSKQFFKQYDANSNGVLEYSEVLSMTQDLAAGLGIVVDEEKLRARLDTETAAGEAALSLDAFCRWIPPLLAGGREPEKEVRSERSQRSAGYLAALKSSPRVVFQLCQQYFKQYDHNGDSFLDDAELMALSKDLSESFDVPLSASPEELRESIAKFSDGSNCLTFSEFAHWFPSILGLNEKFAKEVGDMATEKAR